MSEELILDEKDSEELEEDLEKDVAEIVIVFVWKFLKNMKIMGKKIWKELLAAMLGNAKSNNFLFKGLINLDYKFIDKLELLLENIKKQGALPPNFNSDEAAYTVYSVVMTQFILYLYSEDTTFDIFSKNIENQIRFIFEGKCTIQKDKE